MLNGAGPANLSENVVDRPSDPQSQAGNGRL
jgi:hypothetical protein